MIELQDILRLKFPTASLSRDIIIQDDGQGAYISRWSLGGVSVPSADDLQKWEQEVSTLYQQEQFDLVNKDILLQLEEIDKKSTRALRANDTNRLQGLEGEAKLLRKQLVKQ